MKSILGGEETNGEALAILCLFESASGESSLSASLHFLLPPSRCEPSFPPTFPITLSLCAVHTEVPMCVNHGYVQVEKFGLASPRGTACLGGVRGSRKRLKSIHYQVFQAGFGKMTLKSTNPTASDLLLVLYCRNFIYDNQSRKFQLLKVQQQRLLVTQLQQ